MDIDETLSAIVQCLRRVPAVTVVSAGNEPAANRWWVKLRIDVRNPLAWRVIQELGHVLNYISVDERLPTVFMPVSPPPYMNGGPEEFLSWVIESTADDVKPELIAEMLDGRLPKPVEQADSWALD